LSVVHGIVTQSGGFIDVESGVGVGTTFAILLPPADAAAVAADAGVDAELASGDETLLLVEDDAALRRVLGRGLRRMGYTVVEAGSGNEALDALSERQGRIDLMVTDVVMPIMDGRELAECVRGMYPEIRSLYISGFTDDAITRRGIEVGRDAFLQKPFALDALARRVRQTLGRGEPRARHPGSEGTLGG
jgi:DNA-binding response OmpR family regulator